MSRHDESSDIDGAWTAQHQLAAAARQMADRIDRQLEDKLVAASMLRTGKQRRTIERFRDDLELVLSCLEHGRYSQMTVEAVARLKELRDNINRDLQS